ncbi:hypothetical protein AZI87_04510 [Bdellovibrio bacteriovorus]|uniref:Uncharacterized protein n=1 Tax=Bdellovibrio bacteriovorus TaxID=959 RepID=A0A162GML2_BDEBC|nr:hypothetical protein [Bdellovibrio bacteriovorus]KYG68512.1 hypothetical protein AZI87_04510 [Bdellovibrio bacteriovorus]
MKAGIKILISSLLALSACAPKPEERRFESPRSTFGPKSKDADLNARLRSFNREAPPLTWQGTVLTADFFEQAENLIALGNLRDDEALKNKGLQWIQNFYAQPNATTLVPLAQTPFASLAAAQTQEEVRKTLEEVAIDLEKSRLVLSGAILNLGHGYPWPQQPETLAGLLLHVERFAEAILGSIDGLDMPDMIKDGVKTELRLQTKPLFSDLQRLMVDLQNAKTLNQTLNLVEKVIKDFEVAVPPELQKSLQQGRLIATGLDAIQEEPQAGLTVLIDIWKILTPAEKESYFKPVNEDLYDFLTNQDDKELDCLRKEGCSGGLFKGIAKKVFILPKIKKYGLQQLRQEMNEKTKGYVQSEIEKFAQNFVKELPALFVEKIDAGLVAKSKELAGVQSNYGDYIKKLFATWSEKVLPETKGQLPGFEASHIKVQLSNKTALTLQPQGSITEVQAENIGPSLSANSILLEYGAPETAQSFQAALSQVNKLVSIGGYRDVNGNLIPALLSPVESAKTPLDIMNLAESEFSYRIPDKIRLQDGFHANEEMAYEKNFSAAAFASQIHGLSRMMRVMADWKDTNFDKTLGKIKAQELTGEIQAEALNRSLFPKDMLFTLNLGDVAVLLQDITKKSTPVFLLTLDKKLLWADQYATTTETAVMGGIVDIKAGRKSNAVKTRDMAKFILAIAEFLEATEGVENTKSSILREKNAEGLSALDTLLDGRRDLKLLTVALANFLSNQLMNEKSLLPSYYYLNKLQPSNNPEVNAEEQALSIRALLKAAEVTELETYKWSALEIYYGMNRHLYNDKEGFYIHGDGTKLDFPQKVNVILALETVRPHLNKESRQQLDKIQLPWIRSLQSLK